MLVQVLDSDSNTVYNLKDLIWNSTACSYEFSPDISCSNCQTKPSDSKLLTFKCLIEAPVVVPITLGTTLPIKTKVKLPLELDMVRLVGGTDVAQELQYELYAWIKWEGRRVTSGHYVAYIRDSETTVKLVNDERIIRKDLSTAIEDPNVQKGVKMAFYIRKDCLTTADLPASALNLSLEARFDLEQILNGDIKKTTGLLARNDVFSVMAGKLLNGQTIDSFLYYITLQQKRKIICLNSYVFEKLLLGDVENSVVQNALNTAAIRDSDIVLIPVHLAGGLGHFALMVVYPKLSLMVYADSLQPQLNEQVRKTFLVCLSLLQTFYPTMKLGRFVKGWTLVSTNEIEKQQDAVCCNVFTCLNGYRLITSDSLIHVTKKIQLKKLRYWIFAKARMTKSCPPGQKRSKKPKKAFALINNPFVKLKIKTSLPVGYL